MITTEEAYRRILKNTFPIKSSSTISCKNALGKYLAENVKSDINIPPKNNSAVDGYAINYEKYISNKSLIYKISAEINAGEHYAGTLKKNECVRVSTGAHLPNFLNTVIMQEDVEYKSKQLIKIPAQIIPNKNIRKKGEDIKKGHLILKKNSYLSAQDIGLLSSIGKKEIRVYNKLKVGVLSNGNELVNPGLNKNNNQIYDSNRPMLMSLLKSSFIYCKDYGIVKDEYKKILLKIKKIEKECDLIIVSGGVSMGTRDYLTEIINKIGKIIFSKVSIKPGRPISFGLLKNKLPILLLPGNPVASFVTFNIFAKFLINCMLGNKKFNLRFYKVKANFSMKKKVGREEYIRGKIFTKNNIIYADKFHTEGAGILSSVVWSTGLIRLDSKTEYIKKNDNLDFLPYESFL